MIGSEVSDYWQWDDKDTSVILFCNAAGFGC